MKKPYLISFGVLFLLLLLSLTYSPEASSQTIEAAATTENNVTLVMFYGQGCPHCAKLDEFLGEFQKTAPYLNVERYEVYFNQQNRNLFDKLASAYNTKVGGVPTVFIGDKIIAGFNNELGEQIKSEINRCREEPCISPLEKIGQGGEASDLKNKLTIPAVIGAAAVDAINPCEFAVLIILLTTILASGSRRKALFAGLAFSLAVFISYFLIGLGLYSAIKATGITHIFYTIVAVLAILIGLFNMKDYFWYGKWFVMEVPISWRPRMKALLRSVVSVPGAFLMGIIISLFLLPCTSGPYIVILGLLSKVATRNHAITLLLLYNLIFILPMLIITFAISLGVTTTEKAEEWRQRKLKVLHLIAGIIILLLGIGMFVAMAFGII